MTLHQVKNRKKDNSDKIPLAVNSWDSLRVNRNFQKANREVTLGMQSNKETRSKVFGLQCLCHDKSPQ